jgi:hypothetical protein
MWIKAVQHKAIKKKFMIATKRKEKGRKRRIKFIAFLGAFRQD